MPNVDPSVTSAIKPMSHELINPIAEGTANSQ